MAASEWFIRVGDAVHGPLDAARLRSLAASGKIDPATPVARSSAGPWVPAAKVRGLFAVPGATAADGSPPPGAGGAAPSAPPTESQETVSWADAWEQARTSSAPEPSRPRGSLPDFFHVDLSKLTGSGCLLIVLALLTTLGTALVVMLVANRLGQGVDRSFAKNVALVPGLAAGSGVFILGRRLLERIGRPFLRPDSPRDDD